MRQKKTLNLTLDSTVPTVEIWNLGKKQVLGNQQCAAASFLKPDSLYSVLFRHGFFKKTSVVIVHELGFGFGFFLSCGFQQLQIQD